jgi:hypothetical protein
MPKEIMEQYRSVTLCIDIIFVNKVLFLLTISKNIKFITGSVLENRTEASLVKAIAEIHGIYRSRGFRVVNILGDGEFECTRGALATDLHSNLNICGEDEHVPDIERCIRTIKERTRCTYNVLEVEQYPPKMISEMVFSSIFWLNAFPNRLGISNTLIPRTIVMGMTIDFKEHCRIEYGQYVQTHEQHDNSMTTRTVRAIAMRPTGNEQGSYYLYSLATGRRLHRTRWTELPMPAEVTDRVHALARRARTNRGLTFTDSDGADLDVLFPDDSDNSTYNPDDDNQSYESDEDSDFEPGESDSEDSSTNSGIPATRPRDPGIQGSCRSGPCRKWQCRSGRYRNHRSGRRSRN